MRGRPGGASHARFRTVVRGGRSYRLWGTALATGSPGGTPGDMRSTLTALLASLALAACGGNEDKTNATNDDSPQSSPTVAK